MDGLNYIALMSNNIDALGRNFTASTYGAIAGALAPVMTGLLVLYMIFWGFRFWQGRGETSVIQIAFRLGRIAVVYAMATGWGPMQMGFYQIITQIPSEASSELMNHIIDVGKGSMQTSTIEADLFDFYTYAVKASVVLASTPVAPRAPVAAAAPAPQPVTPPGTPAAAPAAVAPAAMQPTAGSGMNLNSAIIWISAVLFIGYAVFLMLFCKLALLVVLAIAPIFILSLLFQGVSRFFSGWLTTAVQVMLVPIFFYTFLGFYMITIKEIVIALVTSMARGAAPGMKEISPFVLVCFAGLFLLIQIVPLSARIAGGTQKLLDGAIQAGASRASAALAGVAAKGGRGSAAAAGLLGPSGMPPSAGGPASASEISDNLMRDIQDRNLAANRQSNNR